MNVIERVQLQNKLVAAAKRAQAVNKIVQDAAVKDQVESTGTAQRPNLSTVSPVPFAGQPKR